MALDFDIGVMWFSMQRDMEIAKEQAELSKSGQEADVDDVRRADEVSGLLRH